MKPQDAQINESAELFYEGYFSNWGKNTSYPELIKKLILHSFHTYSMEALHDLCFSAKYVTGLYRVLSLARDNPEVKDTSSIQQDLHRNLSTVIEKLNALIADADEDIQMTVVEFTELTAEAFQKLMALIIDLDYLKQYFNLMMRESEKLQE